MIDPAGRWTRVALSDGIAKLEPLCDAHADALHAAANESRETFVYTTAPSDLASTRAYIETARADWERGDGLAFATLDARSGRIVGSTRLARAERWAWAVEPADGRTPHGIDAVEIGWTWLAPSAQRTAINTHAKILMLDYAFDVVGVRRVTLKTDARNQRSRNAIARIGAAFDGVLRAHMQGADGQVRDSAVFSMLKSEWPDHRARLVSAHAR